jgi:hypothetical protein
MSGLACHDIRLALGVYVVGAIDPADRSIVDQHLSQCQECREELAGLAALPALLGRVPRGDAERLALDGAELRELEEPPEELLRSLLDKVAAYRRTRRWRGVLALAAAAVIAVGGGLAGGMAVSSALGHPSSATSGLEFVQGTNAKAHITADVSYAPAASGTTINVRVNGIKDGTTCKFWVVDARGQRWYAGAWTVQPGLEHAWYPASTLVAASSLKDFEVTSGGKILVTVPVS